MPPQLHTGLLDQARVRVLLLSVPSRGQQIASSSTTVAAAGASFQHYAHLLARHNAVRLADLGTGASVSSAAGGTSNRWRDGKLRFNYDDPSPMRVIADGRNVAIGNVKLKTWDLYPLSKTPLSLLLAQRIDLSAGMVKGVKEESDLTTIALGNNTVFGNSTITMMFDPKTYDLRQWTITDNQGKDTSVMIFNTQTGVKFDKSVFAIPYDEVHKRNTNNR